MAAEDQDLMTVRRIIENPLHMPEALLVGVHQGIVKDDERGFARLLEQVGIGQSRHHALGRSCTIAISNLRAPASSDNGP